MTRPRLTVWYNTKCPVCSGGIVFEKGAPAASITIPVWMLRSASKLLPEKAGKALGEQVDIDRIAALAADPKASGVLVEIEDHHRKDRVVISICGGPSPAQK